MKEKKRGAKRMIEKRKWTENRENLRKGCATWKNEATAVSNEEMESGWTERTISSKCSQERK